MFVYIYYNLTLCLMGKSVIAGERPYKCKLCPKDFPTKDTFKKHMLCHSDERSFKCGECGKLFKRITHAKEHLKIHSNDRPYTCSICKKSFKTAVSSIAYNSIYMYTCSTVSSIADNSFYIYMQYSKLYC